MASRKADPALTNRYEGPSWYDAWDLHRTMERALGKRIAIRITPGRGSRNEYGWRCVATFEGADNPYGCGCFGPAFPGNGQKSFAASVYRALLALDEANATAWAADLGMTQSDLPLDSGEEETA